MVGAGTTTNAAAAQSANAPSKRNSDQRILIPRKTRIGDGRSTPAGRGTPAQLPSRMIGPVACGTPPAGSTLMANLSALLIGWLGVNETRASPSAFTGTSPPLTG